MDALIRSNMKPSPKLLQSPKLSSSLPVMLPLSYQKSLTPIPTVAVVALLQKRLALAAVTVMEDEGFGYKRKPINKINYSVMAAAAATEESEDEEMEEGEEEQECKGEKARVGRLTKVIARFGEVYERVEAEKLRQMVDLEKRTMQFAKDLEVQRMRMFMDTQVQLEHIKRGKHSSSNSELSKIKH